MRSLRDAPRVGAILGPTNTGKTHRAIERMLHHRSGMIGLPLRLLAREVYDKVVALRGPDEVALVTGEEKRIPAEPKFFVCTVEAMPVDLRLDFVAVDEIQLAGDRNRGHTFTDRILNARGAVETLFLGSATIEPLLARLVPDLRVETAPRLSKLTYAGTRKLANVPPRSAVIAFSAEAVYETAERLRAVHGGTAVVMGALSPRTRNAQVAMYQAGEVAHLVATDAIGMGLNLDVHHVAFTATRKFDGRVFRELAPAELAQIAGRAGRYRTDGTFGTTREVGELDPALVDALEQHQLPALSALFWRNAALDYSSPEDLLRSLDRPPPQRFLVQAHGEDDEQALASLLRRDEIRERLTSREALERLWAVCQVPDYRKTRTDAHVELLGELALHLLGPSGRVPDSFVEERIRRLDRSEGDIETLMSRIAWIRTWTYVAWQKDWTARPAHWQAVTRAIEDRLSDALHERLTARFVDRRVLLALGAHEAAGAVDVVDGSVRVGGLEVGRVRDHSYQPLPGAPPKAHAAIRRRLRSDLLPALDRLDAAPDDEIAWDPQGRLVWEGAALGRLERGPAPIEPRIAVARLDLLEPQERDRVRRRLDRWLAGWVRAVFAPLDRGMRAELGPAGRGLVHALRTGLGTVDRRDVDAAVAALADDERRSLARMDVRIGTCTVFVQSLLRQRPMEARAALWSVFAGHRPLARPPADGRPALPAPPGERAALEAMGYRVIGGTAVRADVLERVAAELRRMVRAGRPAPIEPVLASLGCGRDEAVAVARGLGFFPDVQPDGRWRVRADRRT